MQNPKSEKINLAVKKIHVRRTHQLSRRVLFTVPVRGTDADIHGSDIRPYLTYRRLG